jgi:putative alpha-1,2-mannosidase
LKLPNGKVFEVKAKDLSKANKYVKTIKLNGQLVTQPTISYDDIKNGGLLEFEMTNKKQE